MTSAERIGSRGRQLLEHQVALMTMYKQGASLTAMAEWLKESPRQIVITAPGLQHWLSSRIALLNKRADEMKGIGHDLFSAESPIGLKMITARDVVERDNEEWHRGERHRTIEEVVGFAGFPDEHLIGLVGPANDFNASHGDPVNETEPGEATSDEPETKPLTVVIGAGPAGLTAAFELASRGHHAVVVYESETQVGGLSKTVVHNDNRIDIGGHRFFSKSDWVMRWWLDKLPLADRSEAATLNDCDGHAFLAYQGMKRDLAVDSLPHGSGEATMLIRDRISRILFAGKLFAYPLKIDVATAWKLGPLDCILFGLSYLKVRVLPVRPEATLEDFFINRFGLRLYRRFFKTYTEKVWGRRCDQISAAWGAQRVKGLSISRAVVHAIRQLVRPSSAATETSLIEHFLYPRLGPGQMWETVAAQLVRDGVTLEMKTEVIGLDYREGRIGEVRTRDEKGFACWQKVDQVVSTMPIRDLIAAMIGPVPVRVREIAGALEYRDFITVGLLYTRLSREGEDDAPTGRASVPDNWIYIQEPDVKVGRLQIFNNWSPYLVAKPVEGSAQVWGASQVWVGLEYFCTEGDALWSLDDAAMKALAIAEMQAIGMAAPEDCLDSVVLKVPKAYPGYYGAYEHFDEVRAFLDSIPNLWCIGRNGMHRYNNQDHSMLSAKAAVDAIVAGSTDKSAIWAVNIDDSYHEEKTGPDDGQGARLIPDEEPTAV